MIEMRKQYAVSASLSVFLKTKATPVQKEKAVVLVDAAIEQMERMDQETTDSSEKYQAVAGLVDSLVKFDMNLALVDKVDIKCRKGCAHCCRQIVAVSTLEAQVLLTKAVELNITLDRSRLERQSKYVEGTWASQPPEDHACLFLSEEGECRVYEQRPLACRKYFVISDPEVCNIVKHPGSEVAVWISLDAEITATATMTHYGSGHMPEKLLEVMGRKDENKEK